MSLRSSDDWGQYHPCPCAANAAELAQVKVQLEIAMKGLRDCAERDDDGYRAKRALRAIAAVKP